MACAAHANSSRLRSLLTERVAECGSAAAALLDEARRFGGTQRGDGDGENDGRDRAARDPAHGGSITAAAADVALLAECEHAEKQLVEAYRDALRHELPPHVLTLVEQQCRALRARRGQFAAVLLESA
jgi:hypothetical protein